MAAIMWLRRETRPSDLAAASRSTRRRPLDVFFRIEFAGGGIHFHGQIGIAAEGADADGFALEVACRSDIRPRHHVECWLFEKPDHRAHRKILARNKA